MYRRRTAFSATVFAAPARCLGLPGTVARALRRGAGLALLLLLAQSAVVSANYAAHPAAIALVDERVQEHEGVFECYDVLLESGNCISVAERHYFLAESGNWVAVHDLETGTRLQTPRGSIAVVSVTKRPMPYVGKVYNLKIEGSDLYLVGKDAVIVRDH